MEEEGTKPDLPLSPIVNTVIEGDEVRGTASSPRFPTSTGEEILPTQGGREETGSRCGTSEQTPFRTLTMRDMIPFFDLREETDSDEEEDSDRESDGTPSPLDTPPPEIGDSETDPDMPPLEDFSDEEFTTKTQKPIPNPYREKTLQHQVPYDPKDELEPKGPEREFIRTFNLSSQEPGTAPTFKVIRHINTNRKIMEWTSTSIKNGCSWGTLTSPNSQLTRLNIYK